MDTDTFLRKVADQLVDMFRPTTNLDIFTTNSILVGDYAEARIREFISNVVFPLRVSRGAVISETICKVPKTVPQIDTIIWSPNPAPAIFTAGDFALVPRSNVFGILEVKSSIYRPSTKKKDRGKRLNEKHPDIRFDENKVWGLVSDICSKLYYDQLENHKDDVTVYPQFPALKVVALRKQGQSDGNFKELRNKGRAVVLFEYNKNEDGNPWTPNQSDIYRFVNFLRITCQRATYREAERWIKIRP